MERKHSVAVGNICKDLQNNVLMENTRERDGYLRWITFIMKHLS